MHRLQLIECLEICMYLLYIPYTCSFQGDELILECVYDSSKRNITTFVSELLSLAIQ